MRTVDRIRHTLTVLLFALIALKVTGLIDISWIIVLAPFWVPASIAGFVVAVERWPD